MGIEITDEPIWSHYTICIKCGTRFGTDKKSKKQVCHECSYRTVRLGARGRSWHKKPNTHQDFELKSINDPDASNEVYTEHIRPSNKPNQPIGKLLG